MKKVASRWKSHYDTLAFIESVIAVAAFICFIILTHSVQTHTFLATDQNLSHLLYSYRSPLLTQIMLLITFLGGSSMLAVAGLGLFIWLFIRKKSDELLLFLSIFPLGYLMSLILKIVVGRARPEIAPLINEVFYSYPSGHSMNSFLLYGLLAYFMYHFTGKKLLSFVTTILCGLILVGIGISRVYLGVHYPSDVLAGFLAGIGWLASILVVSRLTLRKKATK